MKQATLWRIVSGTAMIATSLTFLGLAINNPDYTAALIFVSFVLQMLIYMAYNNSFPAKNE